MMGPADPAGQTYWFAITLSCGSTSCWNTNKCSIDQNYGQTNEVKPISASLIKTTVKPSEVKPVNVSIVKDNEHPVSLDPVSAELVKAKNPEKPTLN